MVFQWIEIRVEVTAEDLERGRACDQERCPLAAAVLRTLGWGSWSDKGLVRNPGKRVRVGSPGKDVVAYCIHLDAGVMGTGWHPLPASLATVVRAVDLGEAVAPVAGHLLLPQEYGGLIDHDACDVKYRKGESGPYYCTYLLETQRAAGLL